MAFTVDYSGDHVYVDGVSAGTFTPAGGSGEAVNAKPTELTKSDFAGGVLGVQPGDRPFIVWGITTGLAAPNSTFLFDSVTYTVIGSALRGDDGQQRLICRQQV